MFQTNHPVIGLGFHDRSAEMGRLEVFVAELRAGTNRWLAIIGPRKVGKTSLILELSRRISDVDFVIVDTQEVSPPSLELFRTYALRVADRVLGRELDNSLEVLAATGDGFDAVLDASATFTALPARIKTVIRALARAEMTDELARLCLDLPERLAEALGRHIVIAIDEFQELASLTRGADVLPIIRSTWQHHRRVGYVVSGSGRTLLENMVTRQHSPFFQHFTLMYVEPFARDEAIALLTAEGGRERPIPAALAGRAVGALGGHPFYLQLLGEAITAREPPYDDAALKDALQDVLFSRTGRLALYFQLGFDRAVGRSTYLAAALDALATGALRMTDIAARIHASTGDTSRYLERLGDVVRKREDGSYELDDPVFGLWLQWRRPGGTVVPMTVIGDAAEREVATVLAHLGFDLVYQARASRGAFDLLATRGAAQLGIQVKRTALPLVFRRTEWQRMTADAKRLGWQWAVASVDPAGVTRFLDPARARRGETIRLGKPAIIESLVAWLDGGSSGHRTRSAARHK
jgi:AAA+ ATPase superfamily predicted ATPase/Holliday junction resolvase